MSQKLERVRSFFDNPDRYLRSGRSSIRIRTETVQEFLQDMQFESILDIGCGDGSLSIPLLRAKNRLTLVDVSKSMLSIARSRIPAEHRGSVHIVNEDFARARLAEQGYDLILCVGFLAHVDDPVKAIRKIAELVKPRGSVVVENADGHHFLSRLWRLRSRMEGTSGDHGCRLNDFPHEAVVQLFQSQGFTLAGSYRYAIGLPGMQKIFSQSQLYRGIRAIYGTSQRNRNASLGNEFLYYFRFPDAGLKDRTR